MSRKSKRKKERIRKRKEERAKMAEDTVLASETRESVMAESPAHTDAAVTKADDTAQSSAYVKEDHKQENDKEKNALKEKKKEEVKDEEPKKLEEAAQVMQIEEATKTVKEEVTSQKTEEKKQSESMQNTKAEKEVAAQATTKKAHHHYHGPRCALRKKIKNLTSIVILLAGFAAGSLFVDIAQLIAQRGFSSHALDAAQVITYDEKTWVKYDEPRVVVDVVVSEDCATECDVVNDLLLELRRFVPTLEAHRIDLSTPQGQIYQQENNITELPTLIFDEELVRTAFYREAKIMFTSHENGTLLLDLDSLDIPQMSLDEEVAQTPENSENAQSTEETASVQ